MRHFLPEYMHGILPSFTSLRRVNSRITPVLATSRIVMKIGLSLIGSLLLCGNGFRSLVLFQPISFVIPLYLVFVLCPPRAEILVSFRFDSLELNFVHYEQPLSIFLILPLERGKIYCYHYLIDKEKRNGNK